MRFIHTTYSLQLWREDHDDPELAVAQRAGAPPRGKRQSSGAAMKELRFALSHPLSLRVSDLERRRVEKARANDALFKKSHRPLVTLDSVIGTLEEKIFASAR